MRPFYRLSPTPGCASRHAPAGRRRPPREAGEGRFCDGLSRRQFLTIGAVGGLALPQLLAAEAKAGIKASHKAVIVVYLPGGPGHQDTFDLKPDAPSDIRGEFKPIKTSVPGIEICEHLPKLAQRMDRVTLIRSLVGARDEHSSHLCLSGYTEAEFRQNNAPTMGAVLSKLLGPVEKTVPPFVNLAARTVHPPYNDPGPGFVGLSHAPHRPRPGERLRLRAGPRPGADCSQRPERAGAGCRRDEP